LVVSVILFLTDWAMVMLASVYINIKMLQSTSQSQYKAGKTASDASTFQPVPLLFRLLGLVPFKKVDLVFLTFIIILIYISFSLSILVFLLTYLLKDPFKFNEDLSIKSLQSSTDQ
jgi:hypothetical protein